MNALAYADTVVTGPNTCVVAGDCTPPLITSARGDIAILSTGSLTAAPGVDDIRVDDTNRFIVNSGTIQTTGFFAEGINIRPGGSNASIINAPGGTISSPFSDTIFVEAPDLSFSNFGVIQGSTGFFVETGGNNATITNELGGNINTTATSIFIDINAPGFSLFNSGTIASTINGGAVVIDSDFITITNYGSGILSSVNGYGIQIGFPISGDIQNSGLITSASAASAGIGIESPFDGSITNNPGGIIQTTAPITAAISIDNPMINISNASVIQATDPTSNAILISASMSDSITNLSTGVMISKSAPTITDLYVNNVSITRGIINYGNIINQTFGNVAIDLQSKTGILIPFTQNGGEIAGEVLLASGGGNVFVMNGGTLDFSVTAANVASTLELNDGVVKGAVNGGTANDIFNVTGGTFGSLNGGGGADTLNVNATYANAGPIINVQTININNAGTVFTLNQPITGLNNQLTINPRTALVDNANISGIGGKIENNGLFRTATTPTISLTGGSFNNNDGSLFVLDSTATVTVNASAFTDNPGSNFVVRIANPTTYGKLIANVPGVDNVSFAAGSFISPRIAGFIPQGSTFNIVTDTGIGGTIEDNSTLIQPSLLVYFIKDLIAGDTILQLKANRNSFSVFSSTEVTEGIAAALDILAQGNGPANQNLLNLLSQFDLLTTQEAIEEGMQSLIPPFNNGLIAGSRIGMNSVFEGVLDRIQQVHLMQCQRRPYHCRLHNYDPYLIFPGTGINYGDWYENGSAWGRVVGANINQNSIRNVPGYKGNVIGGVVGLDAGVNDCTTLGLAASYTKVSIDDRAANEKNEAISSWQATGYSGFEFMHGFFLDAMFGLASNHTQINRKIHVNTLETAAIGEFNGAQYGAQSDLCWSFIENPAYYITPFARVKYIHLNLKDYTETGAADLSLMVTQQNSKELMGGLGFRIGATFETHNRIWVPAEFTAMLARDFINDGEQTIATFLAGGPAFATNGVIPGKNILALGVGLNGIFPDYATFSLKYNAELRHKYMSNVAYLQYLIEWP